MKKKRMYGWGMAGLLLAMGSTAVAADCSRNFMKDPCARNGYSVVETERFVKGPHNCMACVHFFPGEEPDGYCRHESHGKNTVHPRSPVAPVGS
ncbi:hypothetical protein [Nitratifractor sp.]|uniref:hypothetical protein n=1 Tax=Nitratifractor sp. TaxID=2268144 RepID=UPI0025FAEE90|nr:hypothetical protein [Nitratifractor sp.]